MAYIYPDLETCLVGTFEKGIMLKGKCATTEGWKEERERKKKNRETEIDRV